MTNPPNRVEDLKFLILEISENYQTSGSDQVSSSILDDVREDLASILGELTYIEGNDKTVYNKAYRAAYRAATIDHMGGECVLCGETKRSELEIDHVEGDGVKSGSKSGRSPADWKDLSVLQILCKKCHARTDNYKVNKRYM